jgi:hypothetical protein
MEEGRCYLALAKLDFAFVRRHDLDSEKPLPDDERWVVEACAIAQYCTQSQHRLKM